MMVEDGENFTIIAQVRIGRAHSDSILPITKRGQGREVCTDDLNEYIKPKPILNVETLSDEWDVRLLSAIYMPNYHQERAQSFAKKRNKVVSHWAHGFHMKHQILSMRIFRVV